MSKNKLTGDVDKFKDSVVPSGAKVYSFVVVYESTVTNLYVSFDPYINAFHAVSIFRLLV